MAQGLPTFMGGFMAAKQQGLEKKKLEHDSLKIDLATKKLQLESRALEQKQQQNRQKLIQDRIKESAVRFKALGEMAQKLGPQFKAGGALDKLIDQTKDTMAGYIDLVGGDSNIANLLAVQAKLQATVPQKPVTLGPGQQLVNPATGATQAAVPPAAQSQAGKLVADRELFISQFGEGSPQVAAFDEAASTEGGASISEQNTLRSQFLGQSRDFVAVRDAFTKIAAASQDPSPAGDLALIFNFMKLLDPGSVVREGEFATAQNTAGVPERVRNFYNRMLSGERLAPGQREDFLKQAETIFQSQVKSQELLEKNFSGIASGFKSDPKQIVVDLIGDFRAAKPEQKQRKKLKFDAQGNPIQ